MRAVGGQQVSGPQARNSSGSLSVLIVHVCGTRQGPLRAVCFGDVALSPLC